MKSDFNDKEFAAKMLVMLMEEKNEKEIKMKESESKELRKSAEVDSLYYWILSRLYHDADSRIPARPHARISVKGKMSKFNKVWLTQGYQNEYLPRYVVGSEFFDVIEETLKIFDEMDDRYSTTYHRTDDIYEFTVSF